MEPVEDIIISLFFKDLATWGVLKYTDIGYLNRVGGRVAPKFYRVDATKKKTPPGRSPEGRFSATQLHRLSMA